MQILAERGAHGAHEQLPELVLGRSASGLQLDLIVSERDRNCPGFSRALRAIKRFGTLPVETFRRHHAAQLLAFDAIAERLTPLAMACFCASRTGARCTINTSTDTLRSIVEFSRSATFAPAHVSGTADGPVRRAIVIDGIIESAAELDRLLRAASDMQGRSIILCRTAMEDVRRTVTINDAQQRVCVTLLEFPLAERSVNVLGDACAALGATFHDTVTDPLWQCGSFDDVANTCTMLRMGVLLVGQPNAAIDARRSSAMVALANASCEVAAELIQRRLATLGSSVTVTFAANEMQDLQGQTLVAMLLLLDDAARHGVIVCPDGSVHPAGAYQAGVSFLASL